MVSYTGIRATDVLSSQCVAVPGQDVVVGRPRDGDDRVAWLLDHGRFDKALAVLDTDRGLKASTHEQASGHGTPACLMLRHV